MPCTVSRIDCSAMLDWWLPEMSTLTVTMNHELSLVPVSLCLTTLIFPCAWAICHISFLETITKVSSNRRYLGPPFRPVRGAPKGSWKYTSPTNCYGRGYSASRDGFLHLYVIILLWTGAWRPSTSSSISSICEACTLQSQQGSGVHHTTLSCGWTAPYGASLAICFRRAAHSRRSCWHDR